MNDSEKLSDSDIQDLYERNRDLRNARINLAIGVITIFLALWAIILAFISQIIKPESSIYFCRSYLIENCSCSVVPIKAMANNTVFGFPSKAISKPWIPILSSKEPIPCVGL